jgi:class 3 adenylate cyclase
VLPFGEAWMRRFEACLAGSDLLAIDEAAYGGGDGLDLALASRRAMGLALLRAAHVDGEAMQIALYDGAPARGPLGTARDVASWGAAAPASHVIAWPWPRPAPPPPEEPPPRRLKAVLFADLQHFGRLGDAGLAAFYRGPMAAMGRVVAAHAPDYRNAWGDAVQLVFGEAAQAARCAFDLRDVLTPAMLAAAGLPEALVPRIALDFGPLIPVQDAVQGVAKFAGRAMTRAARVEPVTPPGQIHATQAFACEVALSPACGLSCDYVGQTQTAKGFGIMPLYGLRQARDVGA